jgi:hypothetical protein
MVMQLQEENSRSRTAKYRSARAAQVHWLDLLNVVSSRLGTDHRMPSYTNQVRAYGQPQRQ